MLHREGRGREQQASMICVALVDANYTAGRGFGKNREGAVAKAAEDERERRGRGRRFRSMSIIFSQSVG